MNSQLSKKTFFEKSKKVFFKLLKKIFSKKMTLSKSPSRRPQKAKTNGKFDAQKQLQDWFQALQEKTKNCIKEQFQKFIANNTVTDVESGCVSWKKRGMDRGDGVGSRAKDEGRLTFKPFVWLNNNSNKELASDAKVPPTNNENKGPEVNLATMWATIHEAKTHVQDKLVCSHRCHNKKCLNLEHLCWEQQEINNHRNFCKVCTCEHKPKCLVNGPSIVSKEAAAKTIYFDGNKFVNAN
jgi:hypothetical protein